MRVLVTGATGFIGRHLVRQLVRSGHPVRALVRRECSALAGAGVELAWGDVTDKEAVRAAVDGVGVVFHLAAVRDAWGTPEAVYHRVNVEGTRLLLEAAALAGVRRFVHCSSVGVARYPGHLRADETLALDEPTSQVFYHRTKAQAEELAVEYARSGRAPVVVVRPAITYGPEDEGGMVTRLVALLARNRFVMVGDGRNHVDLVYVDDLITGMVLAMERGSVGRAYILCGMRPVQVRALVDTICRLLGRPSPRVCVPVFMARAAGWGMETAYRVGSRLGFDRDGRAPFITRDKVATLTVDRGFSHRRASRELGYYPKVDCDEGLRRTVAWCMEAGFLKRNDPPGIDAG